MVVQWDVIGIVSAGLATFIGATWVLRGMIQKLIDSVKTLHADMSELKAETLTKSQFAEHQLRLALANPSLRIPDPRAPHLVLTIGDGASV